MFGRLVLPSARRPITSSSGILFHHHRRSVALLTSAPAQSIITMPYSTADSVTSKSERFPQKRHHQKPKSSTPRRKALPRLKLKDEILQCAKHLDPNGDILPKSEWIHVNGTLPICSLNEIVTTFEDLLRREEREWGLVDLDSPWNPIQDPKVPTLSLEEENKAIVQAAHVVISPFGRPNGWLLKLPNRSLVNAILTRAQQRHIHVTWKVVQIKEYDYTKEREIRQDPAHANGLLVDDSMVRFENCPHGLKEEEVRLRLSRYDLAPTGKTVIKWHGETTDGKKAPLMYVVRFADASWARAAVRELQSLRVNGKTIKLVQYPNQIRYNDDDYDDNVEDEKGAGGVV